MVALQTLIIILENEETGEAYIKYKDKFNHNMDLLINYYDLFFLFNFQDFVKIGSQHLLTNPKTHLSAQYYM